MSTNFTNPFKAGLSLKRYPHRKNELLQAWDSADELLLQHLARDAAALEGKRILILNDGFGALSCALEGQDLTTYTDSFVSARAIELNSGGRLKAVSELSALTGIYDYALIRVPKNMSFFEDELCHLSRHLGPDSKIICAYMIKHQANSSFELLNKYIGETSTSLAQKKARLIFASFQREPVTSPYPLRVAIEGFEAPFINHSNLFSREKLDIGTRFFMNHLPEGSFRAILDLGCANGIVGIAAKKRYPKARLHFSDDSRMAVESARANYRSYFQDEAEFHWTNCFEGGEPDSLDLALCNPPFHQGNALDEFISRQMFTDAQRALKNGGVLRVIGNTHLPYPLTLKRFFGNSRIVASNNKFLIIDAIKGASAEE